MEYETLWSPPDAEAAASTSAGSLPGPSISVYPPDGPDTANVYLIRTALDMAIVAARGGSGMVRPLQIDKGSGQLGTDPCARPHSRLSYDGQKLLAGHAILAEAAEHAAGDEIAVVLVDTPRRHAVMLCLDHDADALRL